MLQSNFSLKCPHPSNVDTLKGALQLEKKQAAQIDGLQLQMFPNCVDWRIGDIILFAGPKSIASRIISQYQSAISNHHAQWVHVAIYAGNNVILEAVPGQNIRYQHLQSSITVSNVLHVRRHKKLNNLSITDSELRKAVDRQNGKYQMFSGKHIRLLISRISKNKSPFDERPEDALRVAGGKFICSVFVERVLSEFTKEILFKTVPIVCPVDFAISEDFQCVESRWIEG